MSHVAAIDIQIDDLQALKRACMRLKWEFIEDATTFEWYGRHVDTGTKNTSKHRQWIDDKDFGKCQHKIRVPDHLRQSDEQNRGYEIGVQADPTGGYRLVFDDYDKSLLHAVGGDACPVVKQAYGVSKAYQAAAMANAWVTESQEADGTIVLTVRPN